MESKFANNRNILIAVDESENAARSVSYVTGLLAGLPGVHVKLITIIAEPSEDYFMSEGERTAWIEDKKASARSLLEGYRKILVAGGFRDEDVETHAAMKACTSIGECILHEQQRLDCATVVIGRRGISKKEEFIFGSTSNKILHAAKDCAVWVIE